MSEENSECSCEHCISACNNKPGWFAPGEAEKAAELLDMDFQDFFDQYLGADFYFRPKIEDDAIWVLSPAVEGMQTGKEFGFNPSGKCVFLKDGKCSIHESKPLECAFYNHDKDEDTVHEFKQREIISKWEDNQEQISDLLGHEPVRPDDDVDGMMQVMKDAMGGSLLNGMIPNLQNLLENMNNILDNMEEDDGIHSEQQED